MAARKTATAKAVEEQTAEDTRVLADNVVKGGVTYKAGTPVADLPDALRKHVLANEALCVEPDGDNG